MNAHSNHTGKYGREKNRGKNNKCKRGNRNAGKGEIRKEDSRIREGAKGKRHGNKQN